MNVCSNKKKPQKTQNKKTGRKRMEEIAKSESEEIQRYCGRKNIN